MREIITTDLTEVSTTVLASNATTAPVSVPAVATHALPLPEVGTYAEIEGGITAPLGYEAGGIYCGIRKVKKDLALITSAVPASVAAVFTLNKTIAAPLVVDKQLIAKGNGTCTAILVNSGNANACTGAKGMEDAWTMVRETAQVLGLPEEQVLISSTGVIGQYLPMEKIEEGIRNIPAALSANGSADAAAAIMTTDVFAKQIAVEVRGATGTFRIGAIAKGSGMIAPNMATMLAFITTDAKVASDDLRIAFGSKVDRSFNRVSVDGDMSTNDMAIMLANGESGVALTPESVDWPLFNEALDHTLVSLAKMIAKDGEGATKLVEVLVTGARTEDEAVQAARAVANSNLVKTAIHGEDANWGRIIAAVGYSGIDFDPEQMQLSINDVPILDKQYTIVIDEVEAKKALARDTVTISIDLNQGMSEACFWTCDLTKDYVHINASYRS